MLWHFTKALIWLQIGILFSNISWSPRGFRSADMKKDTANWVSFFQQLREMTQQEATKKWRTTLIKLWPVAILRLGTKLGSTERGEKQKKFSNINGLRLITSGSTASLFLLCLKIILQIPKSVQQAAFLQVCKAPVYLRNFIDFGIFFGYSDI